MAKTTVSIPVLSIQFGGGTYGAGGCDVHVGDLNKLPAIAVTFGPRSGNVVERNITDEKGAQKWLHERGLPLMVAWGLVNEVRHGVGEVGPGTPMQIEAGRKVWQQLNMMSHGCGYDSKEARALSEAAQLLKEHDL